MGEVVVARVRIAVLFSNMRKIIMKGVTFVQGKAHTHGVLYEWSD